MVDAILSSYPATSQQLSAPRTAEQDAMAPFNDILAKLATLDQGVQERLTATESDLSQKFSALIDAGAKAQHEPHAIQWTVAMSAETDAATATAQHLSDNGDGSGIDLVAAISRATSLYTRTQSTTMADELFNRSW